jgi:hypothetical protein
MADMAFHDMGIMNPRSPSWDVPVKWILQAAQELDCQGATSMHFVVGILDPKTQKVGDIVDPNKYGLFIEGIDYRGKPVIAEEFPPRLWP